MAKSTEKTKTRKSKVDDLLPFERPNYLIIGGGILTIILGYLALSEHSVEGFLPLTVAPILLLIGYVIIIPIGIMYKKRNGGNGSAETPEA